MGVVFQVVIVGMTIQGDDKYALEGEIGYKQLSLKVNEKVICFVYASMLCFNKNVESFRIYTIYIKCKMLDEAK